MASTAGTVTAPRPNRRTWAVAAAALIGSIGVVAAGAGAPARRASQVRHGDPGVRSRAALVLDESQDKPLFAKHPEEVAPIASITKLMTAMVVLDAGQALDETIEVDRADVDVRKHTHSRLPVGARLARGELLRIALMASENRAAAALGRTYPGGVEECVLAMNRKAAEIGMTRSRFADTSGLSSGNVSSAEDLSRMVLAAAKYPAIREATTTAEHEVTLADGRVIAFRNSNGLVRRKDWTIGLSKTGYIHEAGRCLVMQAEIAARQVVIVLLDSWGRYTRLGDANRIRRWIEATLPAPGTATGEIHRAAPASASGRR